MFCYGNFRRGGSLRVVVLRFDGSGGLMLVEGVTRFVGNCYELASVILFSE